MNLDKLEHYRKRILLYIVIDVIIMLPIIFIAIINHQVFSIIPLIAIFAFVLYSVLTGKNAKEFHKLYSQTLTNLLEQKNIEIAMNGFSYNEINDDSVLYLSENCHYPDYESDYKMSLKHNKRNFKQSFVKISFKYKYYDLSRKDISYKTAILFNGRYIKIDLLNNIPYEYTITNDSFVLKNKINEKTITNIKSKENQYKIYFDRTKESEDYLNNELIAKIDNITKLINSKVLYHIKDNKLITCINNKKKIFFPNLSKKHTINYMESVINKELDFIYDLLNSIQI
ncbi:MAG: DUF3137 domain-containing protein [Bacilli bacterium]|nr:DUF3137 domain-containing protein [Bacilli bacterium]